MALIEVGNRLVKPSKWYGTPIREAGINDFAKMTANLAADSRETAKALFSGRVHGDVTAIKLHNITDCDVFNTDTGKVAGDGWLTKSFPNATLGDIFNYFQGITASGRRKPSLEGFEKYLKETAK